MAHIPTSQASSTDGHIRLDRPDGSSSHFWLEPRHLRQWLAGDFTQAGNCTRSYVCIVDDFGLLVEVRDDHASPRRDFVWDGRTDWYLPTGPELPYSPKPHQTMPITAEVVQQEGEWPELIVSHADVPWTAPHYRLSIGGEESIVASRGQLLALITAAAPLLGLRVSQIAGRRAAVEIHTTAAA